MGVEMMNLEMTREEMWDLGMLYEEEMSDVERRRSARVQQLLGAEQLCHSRWLCPKHSLSIARLSVDSIWSFELVPCRPLYLVLRSRIR
jgi:hypothetical protein